MHNLCLSILLRGKKSTKCCTPPTSHVGSKDNILQAMELSGHQYAAAKLTHYSTMPHRPSDSSRPRQRFLLSCDVHQNPGPVIKYLCSVCTSNVISCGVGYMCNRWSGWVHSKCSGLQNASEYHRIKNSACSSCSSPPAPPTPQRFHHQLQLQMGIPTHNSMQMASATNRLN